MPQPRRHIPTDSPFDTVEFQLRDDFGHLHRYKVHPHNADVGWVLFARLLEMFGPPLGAMIDAVDFSNIGEAVGKVTEAVGKIQETISSVQGAQDVADGAEILASIDFGKLGTSAGKLASSLIADQNVVADLLAHTYRNGELVGGDYGRLYQRNYGELFTVLLKAFAVNFAPLLSARLGRRWTFLQKYAEQIGEAIPPQS